MTKDELFKIIQTCERGLRKMGFDGLSKKPAPSYEENELRELYDSGKLKEARKFIKSL